jgi:hypothetical protein
VVPPLQAVRARVAAASVAMAAPAFLLLNPDMRGSFRVAVVVVVGY